MAERLHNSGHCKGIQNLINGPNQDLTSVKVLGVGKDMMFEMNSLVGLMPSFVIRNPRYLTSDSPNWNLEELKVQPFAEQ